MSDKMYLGDGLYAQWDGEQIMLTADGRYSRDQCSLPK